jgi:mono/diheme cytochrome c family protein
MLPTPSTFAIRHSPFAAGTFFCVILTALCGCNSERSHPAPEAAYPVRADWLVVNVPSSSGQPSKWNDPGYPLLLLLNQPHDTLTGDAALLAVQSRNGVILDTRKGIDPEVREEFGKVLTELFGTPAEPHVPNGDQLIEQVKLNEKLDDLQKIADLKKAELKAKANAPDELQLKQLNSAVDDVEQRASQIDRLRSYETDLKLDPQTLATGGGLYRNYCQQCHGLTGDGNGPGGRFLVPLPRDYRQGLFKFISSDPAIQRRKPSRADLHRTITQGMVGGPMPQFDGLSESDVQAIISYVIHLSIRGETEYQVMKKAADPKGDGMSAKEVGEALKEQAALVAPLWAASNSKRIEIDPNPYITADQKAESAAEGYKLFTSPQVACTTCHTNFGRSSPFQFDAWGSIVRPRNLTIPTLRGGRKPEEIYARICGGIPGSNMPDHTRLRPTPEEREEHKDKIWDLVNFVLYVSESEKRQVLRDKFQIDIEP